MIEFYFEEIDNIELSFDSLTQWINNCVESNNGISGDISFIFCDDNYLLKVNQEYLEHDYYTDIITFNYNVDNIISGDLFISIDRIADNAIKYGIDFNNELYRVIIHGILHLLGFNDKTEEEQVIMREKEAFYLNLMD